MSTTEGTVATAGDIGSLITGLFFLSIAYAAGRWEFDKAGKTIDKYVKDKPQIIAGIVTTAAGIYAHEQAPHHPLTPIITAAGLVLIMEDLMGILQTKYMKSTNESSDAGALLV